MIKKSTGWFAGILLLSQIAQAEILNGNFEAFSNDVPDHWTTIDSGISVSQSTNAFQGASSVGITVNTGSQSSTDFLQNVPVSAGTTYDFSVWVFHTEGHVRARLIVDGYRGYSDSNLTNQWQKMSYQYTATSNATIDVGLRFYDVSGFDGSELVLVDQFEPTASNALCENSVNISILTDNYGDETTWTMQSSGVQVGSGGGYTSNTQYSEDLCLNDGSYVFTIFDQYQDGICCQFGDGNYKLTANNSLVASGGEFGASETVSFTLPLSNSSGNYEGYYEPVSGLTGYALKTGLYNLITSHTTRSYGDLWDFLAENDVDRYYENDGSVLDIYSESPSGTDPYSYTKISDQCGNYRIEGDCYNREHAFPRAWFGGAISPMNTDIHHLFATDGKVNSERSNYPFGEVGSASYTSQNGSLVGSAESGLGHSGTVFEPIAEFKGDLARAYFYMATRYENVIGGWQNNTSNSDAVLNGSSDQVFENWMLSLLKSWHNADPVSQKERERNDAAQAFQNNRNPFVDHPEFVSLIWGN